MIIKYLALLFMFIFFTEINFAQNGNGKKTEISHDLFDTRPTPANSQPIFDKKLGVRKNTKAAMRELRGVWVSTVQRVDFPSRATTNPSVLKSEWLQLLAFYKSLNLNCVIVQVRPAGDAIYPSRLAPISKWLSGKSGRALDGNFDLLKFMVESAHKEGLEFHAWINPYRLIMDGDTTNLDLKHPFKAHRNWVMRYGKEYLLNPGVPDVWRHLSKVVEELARNYPIDAVHFDDYFYPYRIAGETLPDEETFARFGQDFANIEDWRRANTDSLIFNVKKAIKRTRPSVRLGVSPFAVWRNKGRDTEGSATKAYQSCYDDLYADVLNWLKNDWLDYVAPEVYFHIGHPAADYKTIVNWWRDHSFNADLYISHSIYKINNQEKYEEWRDPNEVPRQLDLTRSFYPTASDESAVSNGFPMTEGGIKGVLFFSSKWLLRNELGVTDILKEQYFSEPALLPHDKR